MRKSNLGILTALALASVTLIDDSPKPEKRREKPPVKKRDDTAINRANVMKLWLFDYGNVWAINLKNAKKKAEKLGLGELIGCE